MRIAIIEFDSSHDECLLTQVIALKKRGCWVMLVTNDTVKARNEHLIKWVDEWNEIDPKGGQLNGSAFGDAMIIRCSMRFLKKRKIDKVIFNTAQGGHVRNACLFSLFRKMEFIGIIHTARKFQGSFTQNIINWKIKKYFVLAEFLASASTPLSHRQNSKQVEFFYPLDFPKGDLTLKETNGVHISIIGSVELRRKDLEGFISLVHQSDSSTRFSFLGKADLTNSDVIKLKEELTKVGALQQVEFFQNRLYFSKIDQILRKTSAILPLIHPNTPSADEYFRNQIPGAMNMALGYKIPLLMHRSFETIDELNVASVYYELNDFSTALEQLKSQGDTIRKAMNKSERYSSEYQQKKYLDFVFS